MKAVIPVAGAGTRFRPLTYSMPKALILVAGKPVLNHILESVMRWEPAEAVLVVSPRQAAHYEQLCRESSIPVQIAVQEEPRGLGHAILQARPNVGDEPMLIVYGDTIVDADPTEALDQRADAVLGVQWHDDPRRFGIAELEGERVVRLQEKPPERRPGLVIVGINYVRNTALLFDCLEELVRLSRQTRGEFQATDAFQLMVERGAEVRVFSVRGWYDCGTPETLLETQRALLDGRGGRPPSSDSAAFIPPVSVHPEALVEASVVGPFVTVGPSAQIRRSVISDSVIHGHATIEGVVLEKSIVGGGARIREQPTSALLGVQSRWDRTPGRTRDPEV